MTLPTNTTLTLHTAMVNACRVGAVRLGFVATDTQPNKVGVGASSSGGFFYVWAEASLATTTWTPVS